MKDLTNRQIKKQIKYLKKEKHMLSIDQIDEFIEQISFTLFTIVFLLLFCGVIYGVFLETLKILLSLIILIHILFLVFNNLLNTDYKCKKNEIQSRINEFKNMIGSL